MIRVGAVFKVAGNNGLAVELGWIGILGEAALELFFEVLGAKDRYFDEKQFTGDRAGVGVVQDSPYRDLRSEELKRRERRHGQMTTHKVFELSTSLLDDAVLSAEDDTHSAEIAYFGTADDE